MQHKSYLLHTFSVILAISELIKYALCVRY